MKKTDEQVKAQIDRKYQKDRLILNLESIEDDLKEMGLASYTLGNPVLGAHLRLLALRVLTANEEIQRDYEVIKND